jgi:hypothetical protein
MPAKMSNFGWITFIGYAISEGRFSSFTATPDAGFGSNSLNITFNWFKLSVEIAHLWFFGRGIIPFTSPPCYQAQAPDSAPHTETLVCQT